MLRVNRLTDYAAAVMTCLAEREDDVLSAVEIAECTHLELPTVAKLLKSLSHAQLVESFRGANGGYRLSRAAADISLAEIVVAMEGPIAVTECGTGQCMREAYCAIRGSWQQISAVLDEALRAVSLADMRRRAAGRPAPRIRPQRVAAVNK